MSSTTLGHYQISGKIGAGGMGAVYRAHDEALDRDVAIKLLPGDRFRDANARARLLREARLASQLNHPNICTIYEVGEAEGQAYIAMELVEGEPLSARLERGALPVEEVLRIGLQLAEGLGHAHERSVVHRDFKSANVILTPEGRAKVLDFGLAKRISGEELDGVTRSQLSLTRPEALVGTLAYMPPEQLRGQPADARSDIWALGVVLYEMAAGARPFQGHTGFELSSAILNQRPAALPGKVPVELRAVIERCLEKEPAQRYQRAGEVRAALEAIHTGAAVPWEAWRYRLARRRWLALAAGVGLLLILMVGLNFERLRARFFGAAPRIQSLAVLPLENLSGDPEQDYFADGIHEALITDLAKLTGFRKVTARSSVMAYRGTRKPLPQIARELGVDAVMMGSVLRSGNRVQVTARVINATTEESLWAGRYEGELHDVLSLQNELVDSITRGIRLQLAPRERERLTKARQVNAEAYEAYLKGRFYMNKFTAEGTQKGLAYLRQAIEKDPTHPMPYAWLALAYNDIGHGADPPPDAFAMAKEFARQALELDEAVAEAHEALGEIKLYSDWGDWVGTEQAFRRALELNPNLAEAHRNYSWYLFRSRPDEAIREMKRAQELDPLTPMWNADLAWQYWSLGQPEKAIEQAKKSLELNPDFPFGLWILGAVYADKGMYKEAIDVQQRAQTAGPEWRWVLVRTYALAGRREEARKLALELEKRIEPIYTWGLAEAYAALGDKAEALRWLEKGYEIRWSWMPWIRQNPGFRSLYDDPRFSDLQRRVDSPR